MNKSVARHAVTVSVIVSVMVTLVLALDIAPWLRGGVGWRWPYVPGFSVLRLLPGIVALAIYVAGTLLWLAQT